MIRRAVLLAIALAAGAGCGNGPGPASRIVLSDRYQAVGVARVQPDGVTASSLVIFELLYRDLITSGGALRGKVEVPSRSVSFDLSGEIDGSTGNFTFMQSQGALTSSSSEQIEQLGGTGFDLTPKDGIAEDISGFIRTVRGRLIHQGFYVASPVIAGAPAAADGSKISARATSLGRAEVIGVAGAVPGTSGIELLVYYLAPGDPRFSSAQPMPDGSFRAEVDALADDVVIVRPRAIGVPGPGAAIVVSPL